MGVNFVLFKIECNILECFRFEIKIGFSRAIGTGFQ